MKKRQWIRNVGQLLNHVERDPRSCLLVYARYNSEQLKKEVSGMVAQACSLAWEVEAKGSGVEGQLFHIDLGLVFYLKI